MTGFWRSWMTVWAWIVIAFGVILATGGLSATEGVSRLVYMLIGNPLPETLDAHHRFANALMGAVTIGWGFTLLALLRATDLLGDRAGPVWKGLLTSVLVWYVIDGYLSWATGFPMNIASNTLLLAGLLLPLWRSGVLARKA
jgi:hypothetical protein